MSEATSAASDPISAELDVGDVVVSPRHGPGTVTGRGMRTVDEARHEYLTVALERGGITLMIPVEGVAKARLRPLSSPAIARQALDVLDTAPRSLGVGWRGRQREAAERLRSGDLLDLAALVRDFVHASQARRPPAGERALYQTARELLEAELIAVLGPRAAPEVDQRLPISKEILGKQMGL